MKHPIYRSVPMNRTRDAAIKLITELGFDGTVAKMTDLVIAKTGVKSEEEKTEIEDGVDGQLRSFMVEHLVSMHGHVLIKADKEEWSSSQSRKTLSQMDLSNFNFPFTAGTIVIGDDYFSFSAINTNKEQPTTLNITTAVEGGSKFMFVSGGKPLNKAFDEYNIGEEVRDVLYDVMSILLYIASFTGTSEVASKITPRNNGSKKRNIPKHTVNVINLKPKVIGTNLRGTKKENGSKSDKCWIVRGFWRNQSYKNEEGERYNKPKWISPFWKGSGKEQVERVYKI